jgi:hypothetical protein
LEVVASRLKTFFSTGGRKIILTLYFYRLILNFAGDKWNQDPNKARQTFAEFSEHENNSIDQHEESSDEDLDFDFTRTTFSSYDINLGFKQVGSIEQMIGFLNFIFFYS